MSIQTELARITNAKAAIKTAIEGKGVTVPDGTLLDGMASLIESIEAGGAQMYETDITPAVDVLGSDSSTWITISHNLGVIPRILIIFRVSFVGIVRYEDYFSIAYKMINDEWARAVHVYHNSNNDCYYEYNTNPAAMTEAIIGQDISSSASTLNVNESTLDLIGQNNYIFNRLKAGATYHVVVIA